MDAAVNPAEIFLVEDDLSLQRALQRVLAAAGYAVSCHAEAETLLPELEARVQAQARVCVLMDVNLGRLNGVDAQKLVRQLDAEVPVVFMSAQPEARQVNEAWRDGASNFLFKPFTPKELLDALNEALQKPSLATAAPAAPRPAVPVSPAQLARVASLTPRQRQVFERLAQGMTHQQISAAIGITPRTVKLHRAALMLRLQCRNLPELVRLHDASRQPGA